MRKEFLTLTAIALLSGCAVVEPGARGIKVSMGHMEKGLVQPGMVGLNPLTDQLHERSIQQQTVEGACEPLTADQQQISIKYKVQFRCPEDQLTNLYQNYQGDPYESLVNPQVQEAFRQVVANHKADSVTKDLTVIKNQVLVMVKENVRGLVDVTDIPITHIDLPKVLQDAIAQKQVMEQQSLQKQYELDKANKEAQITVANAEAQAKSIKLQSDALEKSPALIQYEIAKKWNGVLPQTMLSPGGGTIFNLK